MNDINLEGDKRSPTIRFNFQEGKFNISGRSLPEDAFSFYEPILSSIEEYAQKTDRNSTEITINLEYYNTSSSMYLVNILKTLDDMAGKGHQVSIKWYFDQQDSEGWLDVFEENLGNILNHAKPEMIYKR